MPGRSRRVVRELLSEIDLTEHVEYLARDDIQAAIRFMDAAEAAFTRLAETPDPGWFWEFDDPRLVDVRVWPIAGFPNHLIFFSATVDEVRVLRVLHAARDIETALRQQS